MKNIIVLVGASVVIYKTGKFMGKLECLDEIPDHEITFKVGKYGVLTVSKRKKDK